MIASNRFFLHGRISSHSWRTIASNEHDVSLVRLPALFASNCIPGLMKTFSLMATAFLPLAIFRTKIVQREETLAIRSIPRNCDFNDKILRSREQNMLEKSCYSKLIGDVCITQYELLKICHSKLIFIVFLEYCLRRCLHWRLVLRFLK